MMPFKNIFYSHRDFFKRKEYVEHILSVLSCELKVFVHLLLIFCN